MKTIKIRRGFVVLALAAVTIVPVDAKKVHKAAPEKPVINMTSHEMSGNYYCYPWLNQTPPALTAAPDGYEPFHMEHYSRHGSRWHIGYDHYNVPYEILTKASKAGKLTPLGEKTLSAITVIRENAYGREGELSDNGALQHQGIGKRMVRNFPEIFNNKTNLDARSTVVIRSILSMFNGLNGIQSEVPDIHIKSDASRGDMWYMNYNDTLASKIAWGPEGEAIRKPFNSRHMESGEYLNKLFNDPQYAKDSVGSRLYRHLLPALMNAQSHSDQPWLVDEIFTPEEVHSRWLRRNAEWFVGFANSKLTGNRQMFSQSNLLNDIIASTDTAINSTTPSVNLRYGHDTIILPLAALLELNNYGEEINDLEELEGRGWKDYKIIPMGANIQMIFYRKPGSTSDDDVLVKVLLNEEETTLPVGHVTGPYYNWKTLKDYYGKKIAPYVTPKNPFQ